MPDPQGPGAAAAAPGGGALAPAAEPVVAAPAIAAPAPALEPAPAPAPAAAADVAPAAKEPAAPAVDPAAAPAADAAKPGKDKDGNDFKPSLLDAAAKPEDANKPAADAKKPADGEKKPAADATKPAADAKPGEAAKADEPGKDGAPAQAPAPVEYAFTYPEGISADVVNKETMGKFTAVLNEATVKPEVAQKFLDLHLAEMGEATKKIGADLAQKQWDVFNAQQNSWRDAVMADSVLGGARHNTAMKTIMGFVDRYAGDGDQRGRLLTAFRMSGIANNPDFLLMMHNAGVDLVKEAEPHPAPPPRAAAPTREARGLNRYRNTTPAGR